ncbi:MAG: Na+/H+ antiporter NhaA [Flavobacteriia bacterium]|nr:Na+/H+ antiporter NhaA [Flavobacteriia bacterium]OIP45224.1 MAG: Na+/H+ antiporter NhaA [Flavobacteriaceae bacterium CG2_30_31_66]PIV97528.1 MAG: Na+/H+ antiporter NhaA [Flavobacteriaceae bacterium CG17_big_fil_post_rev_8_21_14_2_50_31_13]PIX15357.1 MAG: Na+/H+ antiporter NhaA [Flavobacteriaceae bacterium CG_4_8_14_3_um_filter_31_8]PIY14646.1 MAG: Na+/H+ antiporter NhaA [Flavobacteriaceae bacterium CG_4_10_14_3_um_filter_31_253]PIZ10122.1 MAG: Na+/H+ antiporter NhaA [Flavobacteriaceae bacte
MRLDPIDKILILPITRFINNSTTSGILLFASAIVALILANSPLKEAYHHFWEHTFSIGYDEFRITKSLHHWINDGLMSIFFFVIGLELKREIIAGSLSKPKDALLPIFAGLGGMIFPALLYLTLNSSGETNSGWGIPMATDIAFALGILYMIGDKVPTSLKVFLTALAIADDLGAVLVIAFFYTSEISSISLLIGGVFLGILIIANYIGIRNIFFYGLIGIGGLWMAFLLSGIHATIAGVIAALTIPANVKIQDKQFVEKMNKLTNNFKNSIPNDVTLLTHDQLYIIDKIRYYSKAALTPLQRLEHSMHPMVAYVVMPIFALANAGITFSGDISENIVSNVSLGVILGLVIGKFVGIVTMTKILVKFKIAELPEGLQWKHIYGVALIAGVGFTMSLFITDLAFDNELYIIQAKIGIFIASLISGFGGFLILRKL